MRFRQFIERTTAYGKDNPVATHSMFGNVVKVFKQLKYDGDQIKQLADFPGYLRDALNSLVSSKKIAPKYFADIKDLLDKVVANPDVAQKSFASALEDNLRFSSKQAGSAEQAALEKEDWVQKIAKWLGKGGFSVRQVKDWSPEEFVNLIDINMGDEFGERIKSSPDIVQRAIVSTLGRWKAATRNDPEQIQRKRDLHSAGLAKPGETPHPRLADKKKDLIPPVSTPIHDQPAAPKTPEEWEAWRQKRGGEGRHQYPSPAMNARLSSKDLMATPMAPGVSIAKQIQDLRMRRKAAHTGGGGASQVV